MTAFIKVSYKGKCRIIFSIFRYMVIKKKTLVRVRAEQRPLEAENSAASLLKQITFSIFRYTIIKKRH